MAGDSGMNLHEADYCKRDEKFQIPSTKIQVNNNYKIPMTKTTATGVLDDLSMPDGVVIIPKRAEAGK